MKHHHVLLGIFSFIFMSSLLAVGQSADATRALALETLRHSDLANATRLENEGVVLGKTSGEATGGQVVITPYKEATVLSLLQENHVVIVEYMESGAVVRSIDGLGSLEDQRNSSQAWIFSVNGEESALSADRLVVDVGDQVVWAYR